MRIAVVTFDGFNEIDSFVASAPVGERSQYVAGALAAVAPFVNAGPERAVVGG